MTKNSSSYVWKSWLLPAVSADDLLPAALVPPEEAKSEPLLAVSIMQSINEVIQLVTGTKGVQGPTVVNCI